MVIEADDVIQKDEFEGCKPDEEDLNRWPSDSLKSEATHCFHRSSILLISTHLELEFLFWTARNRFDARSWINTKLCEWSAHQENSTRNDLVRLCKWIIDYSGNNTFSNNYHVLISH